MRGAEPPSTLRPLTFTPYANADAPSQDLIARCVHCGLCLSTCPTFAVLGVEMDSPRGRIRLMKNVWEGRLGADAAAFDDHMNTCLDCRACETACPSGVEFGKLMEGARSQIVATRPRSPAERLIRALAFDVLLPNRFALGAFARFSFLAKRLGAGAVLRLVAPIVHVAGRLADLLEVIPDQAPSGEQLPATIAAQGARRAHAALFSGCVQRAVFGATNAATARVLARNGVEVTVIPDQTCCGALHAHAGERDRARVLAKRNIVAFERAGADVVVVNAAGCGSALKEYGWLLKDDPAWSDRAARFAAKVRDSTEYLAEIGLREAPGPVRAKATYDDPCHLIHGQKIRDQPRALLAAIPELTVVPLAEADWCCGSAGTYNVTRPELSRKLLDRKVDNIKRSGAELVVTANPGCLMQIQSGLRRDAPGVRVVHLIDLLDEAYRAG